MPGGGKITERTLIMVKPGALKRNLAGKILERFESAGLALIAARMVHLDLPRVESFYEMHRGKDFFERLCAYMSSGPCLVAVLEGDGAVWRARQAIGETDPAKWMPGTIRGDFAETVTKNSAHGSDSLESAEREIAFFFGTMELYPRASAGANS